MKTKPITLMSALIIPIAFAYPAAASPPGKGSGVKHVDRDATTAPVQHTIMRHTGPVGKGSRCSH